MRWLALLAAVALACPAAANPIANPPPIAGQLPAQPANGAASVGAVGDLIIIQSSGNGIAATISNASPAVVTMVANTFAAFCIQGSGGTAKCALPLYFTGLTGTNGVSNTTPYWVDPASISGNTFKIATTAANALAGTDVNTTGTDSGTGNPGYYMAASATGEEAMALSLPAGSWTCSAVATFLGVASTAPTLLAIGQAVNNTIPLNTGSDQRTETFTVGAQTETLNGTQTASGLSSPTTFFFNVEETWTGGATSPTVKQRASCYRFQ